MSINTNIHTGNNQGARGSRNSLRSSKQAAVEDEHIMVRGSNSGILVVWEVVNNRMVDSATISTSSILNPMGWEHHQDPQRLVLKDGQEDLMVVDNSTGINEVEENSKSGSMRTDHVKSS